MVSFRQQVKGDAGLDHDGGVTEDDGWEGRKGPGPLQEDEEPKVCVQGHCLGDEDARLIADFVRVRESLERQPCSRFLELLLPRANFGSGRRWLPLPFGFLFSTVDHGPVCVRKQSCDILMSVGWWMCIVHNLETD